MSSSSDSIDVESEIASEPNEDPSPKKAVMYGVDDSPEWYLSALLGLQHYLTMLGGTVSIPLIIFPMLCIEDDDPARGYIISTGFFVSGVITLLQTTFGVRLPIVQGGTLAFLVPTISILSLERNQCPADFAENGWDSMNLTDEEKEEEWQRRMREIQGSIAVASVFEVLVGFTGIVGLALRFVTPLTIAPAVAMIGLTLYTTAADYAAKNWIISMSTLVVIILCSQYLKEISIPVPKYSREKGGCTKGAFQLFKLFPVCIMMFIMIFAKFIYILFQLLLSIFVMWAICAILTATDVLDPDNEARTDIDSQLLKDSDWFRFPYPCAYFIHVNQKFINYSLEFDQFNGAFRTFLHPEFWAFSQGF